MLLEKSNSNCRIVEVLRSQENMPPYKLSNIDNHFLRQNVEYGKIFEIDWRLFIEIS